MGWRLRLSDKTVRKFAELPIHCLRQKCSSRNVVAGSIRCMQIFAGVPWVGGVKWEWCRWKWRFSLLSFTVFRTFYIHSHTTAFTWCDCRWPWRYFKVIRLVSHHISQKRCVIRQKLLQSTNRKSYTSILLVPLLLTLKYIFEGHFSLGCHFHVHFSNLFQAFASRGLPAIAELLVIAVAVMVYALFCSFVGGCVRHCRASVRPETLLAPYLEKCTADFHQTYTAVMHYGSEIKFWGRKGSPWNNIP